VAAALAGPVVARALAADLDDLIGEQAALVLGERVALPEREAAPVVGAHVRDAVARAADRRVIEAVLVAGLAGLAGLAAWGVVARGVVAAGPKGEQDRERKRVGQLQAKQAGHPLG